MKLWFKIQMKSMPKLLLSKKKNTSPVKRLKPHKLMLYMMKNFKNSEPGQNKMRQHVREMATTHELLH